MLQKYLIVPFLLLLSINNRAQTRRYYLGPGNEIVSDSTKAEFYILVEYDKTDSTWKMQQYTLSDTLRVIGSFKDEQLKVPHGKFVVYNLFRISSQRKYSPLSKRIETEIIPLRYYIADSGAYVNGQKEGEWTHFFSDGRIEYIYTYKGDQLNGRFRSYNYTTQKILIEGNYENGSKEGKWLTFAASGDILVEDTYKNNILRKSLHRPSKLKASEQYKYTGGVPGYNFNSYLSEAVDNSNFGDARGRLTLSCTLNKNGKLIVSNFLSQSYFADEIILDAIFAVENAPSWKPAKIKDQLVEISIPVTISIPEKTIEWGDSEQAKRVSEKLFKPMISGF
ncbi:antitoxin component YwqK of YwqJK toxin-antitoxin module [Arcticibacter tournemirensis]|nr:antitoxin component YwqK of YwqJK toxin-antitoxin module [Arcticibacter tournemirensis]